MAFGINLISFFYVLTSFALTAANADECKHRIIFLPQSHPPPEFAGVKMSDSQKNKIVESQLKVASYIGRFPQVPVFSEQVKDKDVSLDMLPADVRAGLKSYYNRIFPRGLPESPDALTDIQKQKLVDNGGEFVQLIRGRASVLHRVYENREASDEINDPIKRWLRTHDSSTDSYPPKIGSLVYGAREKAALTQVQNYFSQNAAQRDVILIYGSNHSFRFYPEQFPSECVIIPSEFQQDWAGRFRSGPEGFPSATAKTEYAKTSDATR
ncbi:MAG: hypothetical protein IPJ71_13090 [Bdellovibrionales bacterium]|nr:hypothetical protein [Bdellovibrionales bacterium]